MARDPLKTHSSLTWRYTGLTREGSYLSVRFADKLRSAKASAICFRTSENIEPIVLNGSASLNKPCFPLSLFPDSCMQ